jgi:hypothetical protein
VTAGGAAQFTLSTNRSGPDNHFPRTWLRVRIHPTVEHLQHAAWQHRPEGGKGYWDGCVGCFHPSIPTGEDQTYAGLLRLAEGHITPEIVAHELLHAACTVYRMRVCSDIRLGTGARGREEALAYIYGELFADFHQRGGHLMDGRDY